jgi:fucose 4-O-acetylase-like acetyltransferase
MNKQRIEWVDTLKFLGIFAIYLGHLGKSGGNAYLFVFKYHVPLFFVISGFFNKKVELNNYLEYIKTSFKKYMYPYYLFAIVTCVYLTLRNNHFSYTYIVNIITGTRNRIWLGLWFFSCLFIAKIMYNLLLAITKDKRITFIISLSLYYLLDLLAKKGIPHIPTLTPKWFWNIDSAFFYLSFYALGDLVFNWLKENYKSMYCIVLYCIVLYFYPNCL